MSHRAWMDRSSHIINLSDGVARNYLKYSRIYSQPRRVWRIVKMPCTVFTPPRKVLTPTPWAVGNGGLNWSAEAFQRTPPSHQRDLLSQPSSTTTSLRRVKAEGYLFLGEASSLDAFSSYLQRLSCPAIARSDNRYARGRVALFLSY